MKAMLLAAGFGERMLPLSLTLPKPAVPVLGRPLSVQILLRMAEAGVEEAVLNLHHLPDVVRKLLGDGAENGLPKTQFTVEESILGTAGGIRNAAPLLRGGGPILLSNSDFLSDIDFRAAYDAHLRSDCLATLVLAGPRAGYSLVDVDDSGRVLSLAGRPEVDPSRIYSRHLFTGCHIIDESLIGRIPPEGPSQIVPDVYRQLAREGRLGSFMHDGFWWEFGSPELYLEGSLQLLGLTTSERAKIMHHDPVRQLDRAQAAVGPGADFDEGSRFRGRVALGFACHVGADSRIKDSVVMPEAWVGPGCRLTRTIVGPGVEIPAGMSFEQALVCEDKAGRTDAVELPPRIRREDGLLIHPFSTQPA